MEKVIEKIIEDEIGGEEYEINLFMGSFVKVITKFIDNSDFVPYVNSSRYADQYVKIRREDLKEAIEELADISYLTFINLSIDFEFIKAEKNRKTIYTSGKDKISYIKKSIVNAIEKYNCSSMM